MTRARAPRALAVLWLALGACKVVWPAGDDLEQLGTAIGTAESTVRAAYWAVTGGELLLGAALWTRRAPRHVRWASLLLSGFALWVWVTVEPLRRSCACAGGALELGAGAKLALILVLLFLSYQSLLSVTAPGGTTPPA